MYICIYIYVCTTTILKHVNLICFIFRLTKKMSSCRFSSGPFGGVLGPSWGHLRGSWAHFGGSWRHLGAILGGLGAIWGLFWARLGTFFGPLRAMCWLLRVEGFAKTYFSRKLNFCTTLLGFLLFLWPEKGENWNKFSQEIVTGGPKKGPRSRKFQKSVPRGRKKARKRLQEATRQPQDGPKRAQDVAKMTRHEGKYAKFGPGRPNFKNDEQPEEN